MPPSGSTGNGRRAVLKAAGLLPGALLASVRAEATDYASPAEALLAIDTVAAEVQARLRTLAAESLAGKAFVTSLLRDHERQGQERKDLRRRLGLAPHSATTAAKVEGADLEELKDAQERLAYALAEALPALDSPAAVRVLAQQMVDASRHLTLIGLWIDAEERRASS